MEMRVPDDWEL